MKKWCLIGLAGMLACSPALYVPTLEVANRKNMDLNNLNEGRQLYTGHCGSCHRLHLPGEFGEQAWRSFTNSMQPRAKITDDEKRLILDYILAGK
ncbi:MAG: c-type cytochrome [Bacteroidales bacterium]